MTSLKNSDLPGAHSPTRGAQRCGRLLACTAVRTSLCRGRSSLRNPSHARGTEWGAAGRRSSRLVPHDGHINLKAAVRGVTRDRRMPGGDPLSLVATSASGRPREATPRGGRSCRGDCRSRRPCWLRWLWGGGGRVRLLSLPPSADQSALVTKPPKNASTRVPTYAPTTHKRLDNAPANAPTNA